MPTDDCWRWPIPPSRKDGRVVVQRRYAYRLLYEMLVGPLGDLDVHHLCENSWCVNPWHLAPMTPSDHAREHTPAPPPPKTTCVNGHDLTDPANIAITTRRSGPRAGRQERHCRQCMTDWKRRRRAVALRS